MARQFDLVIRNGLVLDGTGAAAGEIDIGITAGRIAQMAAALPVGRDEIDARGKLVTPGFVDIHTHYDGQATWSQYLTPSSLHGATTVVLGNCGVGFAPCRPEQHELLIQLMEGVEDIPGVVMKEGIPWDWQSFPEYLDALSRRQYDIDLAVQIGHAPLRVFVMGQRGIDREPATADDLATMTKLTEEAVRAGAFGVSTSRSLFHRSLDGRLIPTVTAAEAELHALARGLTAAGRGVFQLLLDFTADGDDVATEFDLLRRVVQRSGRPLSFTLSEQKHAPQRFRILLGLIAKARAEGLPIRGQIATRPIGVLFGHDLSFNPFNFVPSYAAICQLPRAEWLGALRQPEVRARLLSEQPANWTSEHMKNRSRAVAGMFELGDPPNYEPPADQSLGARAARLGVTPLELAYDILLQNDCKAMLYAPDTNYVQGSLDTTPEMLRHPDTLIGLGDGGAHYGSICDASFSSYLLTHWTRDRTQGERLDLPFAVHALTQRNAQAVGLSDRGVIAPGMKADINVIDIDALQLRPPRMLQDLPAGGRRLMQEAQGFVATIVSGVVAYRHGKRSGNLPGMLVRSGAH